MKFIVEKLNGSVYTYFESDNHFKVVEKERQAANKKLLRKTLDEECCLDNYPDNTYIVVDVGNPRKV